MPKISPAEAAQKWANRTAQAVPEYRDGINRVTEAPGAKAAQQESVMLQNLTAAVQSGKWRRGVESVSLADWKQATLDKGAGRISAGVQQAAPKQVAMYDKLYQSLAAGEAAIASMPRGDFNQNMQRMVAFITAVHDNPVK